MLDNTLSKALEWVKEITEKSEVSGYITAQELSKIIIENYGFRVCFPVTIHFL